MISSHRDGQIIVPKQMGMWEVKNVHYENNSEEHKTQINTSEKGEKMVRLFSHKESEKREQAAKKRSEPLYRFFLSL